MPVSIIEQLAKSIEYEVKIREQADLIERQRKEIRLLYARLSAADVQLRRARRNRVELQQWPINDLNAKVNL
jgi:hypothetical protein